MSDYQLLTHPGLSMQSTRWLTEEVFKLIDLVQKDEAIYNPRHKYYFCRPYVENFWREVDVKLDKNPGASLAKWTNLRISFRREYTNYLDENVPPCWSYFERMYFLHPYLRKKHHQTKSIDSQVQDALVQISSLSNRLQMQRERAAVAATLSANNAQSTITDAHTTNQQQLDHYFDYFDDPEHDVDHDVEHNNSELDDIIDEERQCRFASGDIKSECGDDTSSHDNDDAKKDDNDIIMPDSIEHVEQTDDDDGVRNYDLEPSTPTTTSAINITDKHKQRHLQQLRLQTRLYQDDLRVKRARSQDSINSIQSNGSALRLTINTPCTRDTAVHSNVSFVRPTFTKPIEAVSTTTMQNNINSTTVSTTINPIHRTNDDNLLNLAVTASNTNATTSTSITTIGQQATRSMPYTHHYNQHHHRLELTATPSQTNANNASTSLSPFHELCECKTDPDAMFLMSLLPDIQKLNGRDRGKIKIAFQNILQDYLYPD